MMHLLPGPPTWLRLLVWLRMLRGWHWQDARSTGTFEGQILMSPVPRPYRGGWFTSQGFVPR